MDLVRQLFGLDGKIAIVTGASRGIGRDIALALARAGADLALVARDREQLEEVCREVEHIGRRALPLALDLTAEGAAARMADQVHDHFGTIDILVNNAGMNIPKPALEVERQDWERVIDLNLSSVFFSCQAVGAYMAANKRGKIINISSQMALVGYFKRAAYCSSKGGVMQLTRALAIEWAQYNINVNAIAPTFIETPMTRPMFEDAEFLKDVLGRIPMGRLGKTDDLLGAVIYLSSPASDFVTGHTLTVDGGWTVW
jgi:2-deoxy-D-gluconate 3-dehydrogenase